MRIVLPVAFGLILTQSAFAETMYVHLTCYSGGGSGRAQTTFSGAMIADKADVHFDANGITITGREIAKNTSKVASTSCPYTYIASEDYWDGTQWNVRDVTAKRDWNALRAHRANRVSFLTCDRGSKLSTYDTRAGFLNDLYLKSRGNRLGEVPHSDCFVDDLDRTE